MRRGEGFITHTLVEIVDGDFVVLEDFRTLTGHLLVIDLGGPRYLMTKTAESTAPVAPVSLEQAQAGSDAADAGKDDPDYDSLADAFPPIRHLDGDGYAWIGIPGHALSLSLAGTTAEFDPASIQPSNTAVSAGGGTLAGHAGGHLTVAS